MLLRRRLALRYGSLVSPVERFQTVPFCDFSLAHAQNDERYSVVCNLLLSQTRSRSLWKGLQLHALVVKSGMRTFPNVSHQLINFYSKLQLPILSCRVFEETLCRTSTTWSSVISSFAQNDMPLLAMEYFRLMVRDGLRSDDHILPSVLKACATMELSNIGGSVHCMAAKWGFNFDVYVGSAVIDMYAKCTKMKDARRLFEEMPLKNVVTWSAMVRGYSQLGEEEEAMRLFKEALCEGLNVNDFTLSSVIQMCGSSTLLELGKQVHGLCLKTSFDKSSFVASSLVSLHSKCGSVEGAYQIFDETPERNLGLWNAMLIACAQHGHTEEAFDLFKKMEGDGIRPNFITFLSIIYACSHAGFVEEGRRYFSLMNEYGIEPGAHHYASFVYLLGRGGQLQEALSVIEKMPMEPTEAVWAAFLTGCRIHKNNDMAAFAADKIVEVEIRSPGLHMLLFNAYTAAGRYEDAAKVRKMLKDRGAYKETGFSWVEEGNKVHRFSSGDRSHKKTSEIYLKLEDLEEEILKDGHPADAMLLWPELGKGERRETARYHSERLAIAFALLSFPPYRPIRVMKNLRICKDCHKAIKLISKCTGRTIIVRDNNRFHRFENGRCSCNDYW